MNRFCAKCQKPISKTAKQDYKLMEMRESIYYGVDDSPRP